MTFRIPLFIVSLCLTIQLHGQVTIGSKTKPNIGSLLDLTQGDVTTKGLGLPRVQLKALDELIISDHVIAPGDTAAWLAHCGLMVYNVAGCINPGVYVWNGYSWDAIKGAGKEDALFQPNSYWVTPGTREIEIPVEKAFRIWECYGSTGGNSRLPNETVSGTLTPLLYWQDAEIITGSSSLSISGSSRYDIITVVLAGGTTKGNAVIALQDGSGTIRWSWHIWVTDDPTTANLNGNGYTWMDRYLGATSTALGDSTSIGLTYQWGRKDPFPTPITWANTGDDVILQNTHGEIVYEVDKSINVGSDRKINFKNSITSPLSFITSYFDIIGDWYCERGTPSSEQWYWRWDRTEDGTFRKTPFDPCPKGWRVPDMQYDKDGALIANSSPWNGLSADDNVWNNGFSWEDFGNYTASGYRNNQSGRPHNQGILSYIWTAKRFYALHIQKESTARTVDSAISGIGGAVRCIKEQ